MTSRTSGHGFRKFFSPKELEEIVTLRQELVERLTCRDDEYSSVIARHKLNEQAREEAKMNRVEMERERGWYWVLPRGGRTWEVALYENDGNWYRAGIMTESATARFDQIGPQLVHPSTPTGGATELAHDWNA